MPLPNTSPWPNMYMIRPRRTFPFTAILIPIITLYNLIIQSTTDIHHTNRRLTANYLLTEDFDFVNSRLIISTWSRA